jgi:hypothetical protein
MFFKFQSEIQKRYAVDLSAPSSSGGHGMLWRVFSAVKKQAKKEQNGNCQESVSIFMFSKEDKEFKGLNKRDSDALLSVLRNDIDTMQR